MIKVNYDTETTLVKGYYPDSINYASIPEPFIKIEDNEQVLDKQMCVVGGVYQEYKTPDSVLLEQEKVVKIAQCKQYLVETDWQANAFIKYGRPIDSGVKENCLKAKKLKADIEACTTLKELEKINVNFE